MQPTDVFVLLLGWLVASFETRAPHLAQLLDCVTCDGELLRLAMLAHPCAMDATVAAAHFPQLQAVAGKAPFSTSIGSGAETGGFSSSLQSCSSLMAFDMNGEGTPGVDFFQILIAFRMLKHACRPLVLVTGAGLHPQLHCSSEKFDLHCRSNVCLPLLVP